MNSYKIIVDSACDLPLSLLESEGLTCARLTYRFENEDEHTDYELSPSHFYGRLRSGEVAKTAAINAETFKNVFERELKAGFDVLYLGFSSGLSSTYNSGRLAAQELAECYPERKIIAVDTLCGSAGFGLLVYLVNAEKSRGATIEQAAQLATEMRLKICHWVTVDTLEFLKKGGRISSATALIGGILNIKPVMRVDDEGRLISFKKVRGRLAAIEELAKKAAETALSKYPIFISHADCREDADALAAKIRELCGKAVTLITDVGAAVGAHGGPGSLALFFVGDKR